MLYNPSDILSEAKRLEPVLRDIRRDLHRHPELGFQEFRTTAKIKEHLSALPGVEIKPLAMETGVMADLPGTKPEKGTVALRCDIDALPLQEENTHGFQSEEPGKMHGCGHDGHVAVNLGAAMLLSKFRPERNVRFLFQPAEECNPDGAPPFLACGVLDGVDEAWGFHLNATSDFGNVGWYDGAVMAGGTGARITVTGKSGHPSYPEACVNPIDIVSRIWVEIAGIKQTVRGTRPYALAAASIQSGQPFDEATPTTGELTLRTCFLEKEIDRHLRERIESIARHFCELYGATCEVRFRDHFPITYNHPGLGGLVRDHAKAFGLPVEQIFPSMGSDDFGYYADLVPAYYMTFGIRKGADFPIAHTPHFNFDEAILPPSAAMFASCALEEEAVPLGVAAL